MWIKNSNRTKVLLKLKILVIVALGSLSAVLLADMQANEQTAEHIARGLYKELQNKSKEVGIQNMPEGITKEYYTVSAKKISESAYEAMKQNGITDAVAYKVEYEIFPFEIDKRIRRVHLTVHWQPEPNKEHYRTFRMKTAISE